MLDTLQKAHFHCSFNKKEIAKSKVVGCFYCIRAFNPSFVKKYVGPKSKTAICPFCNIDALIGDKSGYPIEEKFLQEMHDRWFKIKDLSKDHSKKLDIKKYESVEEMLFDLSEDHETVKFAEEFQKYSDNFKIRLRRWFWVKLLLLKIFINKLKYPRNVIPAGPYCYSHDTSKPIKDGKIPIIRCPYWELRPDKPQQENGYCKLLNLGDWQVGQDSGNTGSSMLWDQLKECNINE